MIASLRRANMGDMTPHAAATAAVLFRMILLAAPALLARHPVAAGERPFSPDAILEHVRFLAAAELEGRRAGSPEERRAAEYVAERLEAAGIPAPPGRERLDVFSIGGTRGGDQRTSVNVLGWIPRGGGTERPGAGGGEKPGGGDRDVIVLGARIDHLGRSGDDVYLGAEDNASGVAVVIEVAAALERRRDELGRDVVVAWVSAEDCIAEHERFLESLGEE